MASIPSSSSSPSPSQPKARKKPGQTTSPLPPPQTKWRTGTQERLYSRRLVDALQATRDLSQPPESVGSRAVKEAADSALAMTARVQSRWSRAILFSRNSCRKRVLVKAGGKIRRHRRKHQAIPPAMAGEGAASGVLKERKVKERLNKLGRIVPGCKKLPAATLLEEAADYVAALEMQVRTMRALAEALSAVAVSVPEEEEMEIAEQGAEDEMRHSGTSKISKNHIIERRAFHFGIRAWKEIIDKFSLERRNSSRARSKKLIVDNFDWLGRLD